MQYASPMVLRGLLYQLTGDPDLIAMAPGTAAKFGTGREMAHERDRAALVGRRVVDRHEARVRPEACSHEHPRVRFSSCAGYPFVIKPDG